MALPATRAAGALARFLLALFTSLGTLAIPPHSSAFAAASRIHVQGDHFVDGTGQPLFLFGVNYEGPTHQAWQMWDDTKFTPVLIRQDFARVQGTDAIGVLRIFLQQPLANDISAKRWTKLDQVLDLADQYGLKTILTFADYSEGDLTKLALVDTAVAARYRGRTTILAYDLKNEPRFSDLSLMQYPSAFRVPLQDPSVVAAVGETVARPDIAAYRKSDQGTQDIPSRVSDDQAYVYANLLSAYRGFLADARDWARGHNSTTVGYLGSSDSAGWGPLKDALNDTLATWIKIRADAVRGADPSALITIGHVDPVIASLPANNWLDYRDFHRYPAQSSASIKTTMFLLDDMRSALPTKPFVLGEFGFSNASADEQQSASLEQEMIQSFRDHGGAGALKWMLNDFPDGANPRENAFGMYRGDGTPKPVVAALQSLKGIQPSVKTPISWPADFDIANGHFFTQTDPQADLSGFAVTNDDAIPFWDTWQTLGLSSAGYPLSGRFVWGGLVTQVFQKVALQWDPSNGVTAANLMDELHARGFDAVLLGSRLSPLPVPASSVLGTTPDDSVQRRIALLKANPPLQASYAAGPNSTLLYGLPASAPQDLIDDVAVRTQRTVLYLWKHDTLGAKAGEITAANSGEIAANFRLFPLGPLVPQPPPAQVLSAEDDG